jgi:hypothetical protein
MENINKRGTVKKYKRYILATLYRGYQVEKYCTAKSVNEAAEKFGCVPYSVRKYALIGTVDEPIEGVMAQIDYGYIIFSEGRKDLMRKIMPWDELRLIIDFYVNKKYENPNASIYNMSK